MSGPKLTRGSIHFAKFAGVFDSDMRKKVAELLGNRMNKFIRFAPLGAHFETADERKKAFFELVSAVTGAAPPSDSDQYCTNLIKAWKDGGSSTVLAIETYYFLYTQSYGQPIVEQIDYEMFNQKRFKDHFGASVPGAYIERDEQTAHRRTLRPKHELKLQLPAKSSNELHFSNQKLALIGREAEMASLQEFANMEPGFRWLQIAGSAGQGKSRLALELIQRLPKEWSKGFLDRQELVGFASKWRQWEPTSPHLIVIDYVHGAEVEIGNTMRTLASRSSDFELPVRVLLIERQPWDRQWLHSSATGENGEDDIASAIFANGWATWFYELNRATDGNDLAHSAFRWNSGLVELRNLSPQQLVQIVRKLANGKADLIDDRNLQARLARLDGSGRPLYAYFLGLAYQDGNTGDWTRPDLLRSTLERERDKRWAKAFADMPPNLASDDQALDIAVLASMVRKLNLRSLPPETPIGDADDLVRRQAAALTGTSSDTPLLGTIPIIRGLEPDLLGEWFVLTAIEQNVKRLNLIGEAWRINPIETAAFMMRVAQDFPDYPVTHQFLNYVPATTTAQEAYTTLAQTAFFMLWNHEDGIPWAILEAIDNQAKAENLGAKVCLGYAFFNGVGAKKNQRLGAYLWSQAAEAGDTRAMALIADCWAHGMGFPEKNDEQSFAWFKLAAEKGETAAMAPLAYRYLYGIGTNDDFGKGIYWYTEGAVRGDQDAAKMLEKIGSDPILWKGALSAYHFELEMRRLKALEEKQAEDYAAQERVSLVASAKLLMSSTLDGIKRWLK